MRHKLSVDSLNVSEVDLNATDILVQFEAVPLKCCRALAP